MDRWIPLTLALNSLNRSMGHNDFYPFVIPAPAISKLAFVHTVIREWPRSQLAQKPVLRGLSREPDTGRAVP
jgi:hypothetical protein